MSSTGSQHRQASTTLKRRPKRNISTFFDDSQVGTLLLTGHLPLQLENNEGIAGTILSMESYNLGLDYLLKYRDMIYSLSKDDLLAAAQRYWNPEAFVLAVAGPDEG